MRLIYGKYIGQLADEVLSEIETQRQKAHFRRAFLVVPDARTLSLEQRYLAMLPEGSLMRAEILSFSRLALRMAQEGAVVLPPLLSPQAQALVLRAILLKDKENYPVLAPLARTSAYLEELRVELGSLRRLGYNAELLAEYARATEAQEGSYPSSEKMAEMTNLIAAYDERLKRLGKRDSSADLDFLQRLLREWAEVGTCPSSLSDSAFYFLGFGENRDFSYQEESVILALASLGMDVTLSFVADYFPASGESVEAGAMAWRQGRRALYDWSRRCPDARVSRVSRVEPGLASRMEFLYNAARSVEPSACPESDSIYCRLMAAGQARPMLEKVLGYIQYKVKHEARRYKDFALCFCDAGLAERYLPELLEYYKIPAFIDERITLAQTRLFREMTAFMNMALSCFSLSATCDLLRLNSSEEDWEKIDLFENYALYKALDYGKIFTERYYKDEGNPDWANVALLVVQEKLQPLKKSAEAFRQSKTSGEAVAALFAYLEAAAVEGRIRETYDITMSEGKAEQARALSVAWNSLLSLLEDSLTLLPEGDMQAQEFRELFLRAANSAFIGRVPSLVDEVYVGNPHTSLSQRPKQVILLNPTALNLPGRVPRRGVLSDLDYHVLEKRSQRRLPLRDEDAPFEDSFFIHQLLTSGEEMPMIVRSNEDAPLPHFLLALLGLKDYKDLSQAMSRACREDEELRLFSAQLRGQFEKQVKRPETASDSIRVTRLLLPETKRLTENKVFSVAQLERYAACPYSYLMQYVLGLTKRSTALMDATSSGKLRHLLLDKLLGECLGSEQEALMNPGWEERFRTALESDELLRLLQNLEAKEELPEVFLELGSFGKYTRPALQAAKDCAILFSSQFSPGHIWPLATEWSFGKQRNNAFVLSDPEDTAFSIALSGQVDRIDQVNHMGKRWLNILDYKSSERKVDYFALWEGLDFQLPVYLMAVQETFRLKAEELGEAAYFHVKRLSDLNLWNQVENSLQDHLFKPDLRSDARSVLLERSRFKRLSAAKDIRRGYFPLKPRAPKGKNACKYCTVRSLCYFDQPDYENETLSFKGKKDWLEREDVQQAFGLVPDSDSGGAEKAERAGN